MFWALELGRRVSVMWEGVEEGSGGDWRRKNVVWRGHLPFLHFNCGDLIDRLREP